MTIEQMVEMVRDLAEDETCPICKDHGFITCPDHGAKVDEDGWCIRCDTPDDGGPAGKITCPCNWG